MSYEIHLSEEVGAVVAHAPMTGTRVQVSLRKVAEQMIARGKLAPLTEADLQYLATLGSTEVGAIGKAISKAAKKAVAPVKKVAKAVASTKVVKGVVKVASKVAPFPAGLAISGAQSAAKLGKALKKGDPKAKKIAPVVKAVAKGKATPAQLTAAAKKAGVSPQLALEAAGVAKVAEMAAAGDPKAVAALNIASQITSPDVKDQNKAADTIGQLAVVQAAQSGDATAYMVTTPDGQSFKTLVIPNTAA